MRTSADVDAAIEAHEAGTVRRLQRLRALIHRIAEEAEAGPLFETLKWGQPAFLTKETGSGSTIRIDATKRPGEVAVYFICTTRLVDTFRERFPELRYEGSRAILFGPDEPIDDEALSHCLAIALTHKREPGRAGTGR